MKKQKWYCYICGKRISNEFLLWSLNDQIDRVFLLCNKEQCEERLGNDAIIIYVEKNDKRYS